MAGMAALTPVSVPVAPGTTGVCSVRVRNTGTLVDQFTVTVLGTPAAWTTVAPPVLSLFPGAEGTVQLHFAPPRTPGVGLGATPFAVRVEAQEDPEGTVVEEGVVDLQPYREVAFKVTPRTSEGKGSARHEVVVDNRGNSPIEVELAASDPDEQLAFELRPRQLTLQSGQTQRAGVKVIARKRFARGPDKQRPFQVTASVAGDAPEAATRLDATMVQKAGLPKFILPLAAAVVASAVLAAVVLPALRKGGDSSGSLRLTAEEKATTTLPEEEAPAEDPAAAQAEAEAAAAAELAANGQDPATAAVPAGALGGSGSQQAAGAGAVAGTPATSPPATAAPATTPPGVPGSMYSLSKSTSDGHFETVAPKTAVGQTFKATKGQLTEASFTLTGTNVVVVVWKVGASPRGTRIGQSGTVAITNGGETRIVFELPPTLHAGESYFLEVQAEGGEMKALFSNTDDYLDGNGYVEGTPHGHDMAAKIIGR